MDETTLNRLWAKIGREKKDTYDGRHPLACHLLDVGMAARLLWDEVLRPGVRRRVTAALGLGADVGAAGRWLAFWAAAHDLGKAAPGFQSKRKEAVAPLRSAGFDFRRADYHPHQYVSTAALAVLLAVPGEGRPAVSGGLARRVAIAVGGHHGLFPGAAEWHCLPPSKLGCGPSWDDARRSLLDRLAGVYRLADGPVPAEPAGCNAHWPMMILAGLVAVADWIGSHKGFFPHEPGAVDIAAYAAVARNRACSALRELGWLDRGVASAAPKTFAELFGFPPRPLQEKAAEVAETLDGPGLVLVEAPMGEGKTEAALLLADRWTHGTDRAGWPLGGQGLYVAMPTMATGNQMFARVARFLRGRHPDDVVNLQLLHSGAMLSERFEAMQREAEVRRQGFRPGETYDDASAGAVVAESWFAQNKKQAILAAFGVGTVDQALLSVLQVRHGFVRLFGLAGKTVVLDEVHAYDAYMSALLERLLEWLSALGCSVVMLSATLPSERRRALMRAWTGAEPPAGATPYPRLTAALSGTVTTHTFAADPARRKTVAVEWRDPRSLAGDLETALSAGGCAAVIRNTVAEAQETYVALRDALRERGFDVRLFHARFPFEDRQRLESEVLAAFGKGPDGRADNPQRPARAVLVATQVVEQSLDLDFDLMATDPAPVDLVLQRAGRLHRHDRPDRPLPKPTLWLLRPEGFDAVPSFGRGHEMVYDRHILLRSVLALRNRPAVVLPDDIDGLVESVYTGDGRADAPDDAWRKALAESRAEMSAEQQEARKAAKLFCLSAPSSPERFIGNARCLDDENPDRPREQQAVTRLSEPTVQLVLLPQGSGWAGRTKPPTLAEARRLLARAVTLQDKRAVAHFVGRPVPPGWAESGLLRFHRLAELDGAGEYCGGGLRLRADPELGIAIPGDA